MLQSEMAVDLVEKCARLHIFSAFKLISLGTEHVNQEINSGKSFFYKEKSKKNF